MIQAYKNFFKGYADFTGRSTRSDFWWVWLMNSILFLPLYIFWFQMALNDTEETDPILGVAIISVYMILAIVLFTPSLAVKVRRLRDAGFHWAFIFLHFVPIDLKKLKSKKFPPLNNVTSVGKGIFPSQVQIKRLPSLGDTRFGGLLLNLSFVNDLKYPLFGEQSSQDDSP